MNVYTFYLLLSYIWGTFSSVLFYWDPYERQFDCIVGIAVENKPVGIGTLIYEDLVVTSANPLETYIKQPGDVYEDRQHQIKVIAFDEQWDKSKPLVIKRFIKNICNREEVWIKMGHLEEHSPIHDLIFISIKKDQIAEPGGYYRSAFYLDIEYNYYFKNGLTFAGFGYVDRVHIKNNTILEYRVYKDSDEVDCDEWIPRAWGRFVCILNVDNLYGIQSGAPLFQNGTLRGVGSFAIQKGNESILVFTDFGLYREVLQKENSITTTIKPKLRRIKNK